MVWLNANEKHGCALYFDIYRTERHEDPTPRYTFAGILGDGRFEGEVQIEIGPSVNITFADAWLNPSALEEFFTRVAQAEVELALQESCRDLAIQADADAQAAPRPHRQPSRRKPLRTGEEFCLNLT